MKPTYKILANQKDITDTLNDRLLSLSLHDEIGLYSDTCTFTLDNRYPKIRAPNDNTVLDVYIGYAESGLIYKGQFKVDRFELSSPPDTMTIQASAADFKASFKSPKSRSWDATTLEKLVTTIAREQSYEPILHESLKNQPVPHLDQTEESDLHFLTRVGYDFGVTIKPVAGKLISLPKGQNETVKGNPLKPIPITEKHIKSYRLSIKERGRYRTVQARWYNVATGQEHEIQVGADEPSYRIRSMFSDETSARYAAQGRLQRFLEGHKECSLELIGIPELFAEGQVLIQTPSQPEINGAWSIKSVDHEVNGMGYVTNCTLSKGISSS